MPGHYYLGSGGGGEGGVAVGTEGERRGRGKGEAGPLREGWVCRIVQLGERGGGSAGRGGRGGRVEAGGGGGGGGAQDPVLIACDRSSKGLMGVVSLRPPGFCERAASGPCGRDWVPGPSAVSCPGASAPRWEGADADAWPSRPAAWQSWPVVLLS